MYRNRQKLRLKKHTDRRDANRHLLYNYRWQKESQQFLAEHPLCQCTQCDEGRIRIKPATVVDHVIPHEGNLDLFWDRNNWQAMAKECHDLKTARENGRSKKCIPGHDAQGFPIDKQHHWNQ